MTDHDRPITFEGATYLPIVFAGMSADRRETAMKSGNQEAYGIIDGTHVVLPDLLGDRYRGAEVAHIVTDWALPLMVIARHRKWIRAVAFTGSTFVATLEGRTQVLSRPAGGRFGGVFTQTCPYKLGGSFCGVDMSASGRTQPGIRVDTITTQRMVVVTRPSTWTGSFDDDFFRDGEIAWRWSVPVEAGQSTDSPGPTGLTDATQSWTTNEFVGMEMRILDGNDGAVVEYSEITANTATTLTFNTLATTYPVGTYFDICGFTDNKDHVSPLVGYRDSDRRLSLLFPTPFDIAVGDSGIVQAGCNGLFTTCKNKFGNQLNFGGDAEAPTAGKVLEPPPDQ